MSVVLGSWHRLLHVRALLTRWYYREEVSSQFFTSSPFRTSTSSKVDPAATVTGRKKGITSTSSRIRSRNARSEISWVFHDRFICDERFRKSMIELGRTEEVIREMDKLANEDHTHITSEEELNVYRSNWWIRSNFVGSDTMPVRHRADFKETLVYLASPQEPRGSSLLPKLVAKLFLVLVELARFLVASLIWDITATMDPALIDRGNLINGDWAQLFVEWFS